MYQVEEASYKDWNTNLIRCQKINLLQSWQYGDAKQESSKFKVHRFLIKNDNKQVVGIAQTLSLSIPKLLGVVRMNRGPLMISDIKKKQDPKDLQKVIVALLGEFKKRRWFFIQIAPESNDVKSTNDFLKRIGLKRVSTPSYSSGLLNLKASEKDLLMGLKKKWRYSLKQSKSHKVNVTILDGNSKDYEILLKRYTEFKIKNNFFGVSDSLLLLLSRKNAKQWQFNFFVAQQIGSSNIKNCYGMLVTIFHGDSATYFLGETNNKGRELQVNYLLLWTAIMHAKSNGYNWFDIGGLDASTPTGIAHFKRGLQSEPYSLIGEWRGLILPWKKYQKMS